MKFLSLRRTCSVFYKRLVGEDNVDPVEDIADHNIIAAVFCLEIVKNVLFKHFSSNENADKGSPERFKRYFFDLEPFQSVLRGIVSNELFGLYDKLVDDVGEESYQE